MGLPCTQRRRHACRHSPRFCFLLLFSGLIVHIVVVVVVDIIRTLVVSSGRTTAHCSIRGPCQMLVDTELVCHTSLLVELLSSRRDIVRAGSSLWRMVWMTAVFVAQPLQSDGPNVRRTEQVRNPKSKLHSSPTLAYQNPGPDEPSGTTIAELDRNPSSRPFLPVFSKFAFGIPVSLRTATWDTTAATISQMVIASALCPRSRFDWSIVIFECAREM